MQNAPHNVIELFCFLARSFGYVRTGVILAHTNIGITPKRYKGTPCVLVNAAQR